MTCCISSPLRSCSSAARVASAKACDSLAVDERLEQLLRERDLLGEHQLMDRRHRCVEHVRPHVGAGLDGQQVENDAMFEPADGIFRDGLAPRRDAFAWVVADTFEVAGIGTHRGELASIRGGHERCRPNTTRAVSAASAHMRRNRRRRREVIARPPLPPSPGHCDAPTRRGRASGTRLPIVLSRPHPVDTSSPRTRQP